MPGIKAAAAAMVFGALFVAGAMPGAAPVQAAPVRTGEAACAVAKAAVSAQRRFSVSRIRLCDTANPVHNPPGFYVFGLHGWCGDEICGSTLMGWFAVQKATGRVFEWNVAENKLGPPIASRL